MTDNTAFAAMVITGLIVGVIFGTIRICQETETNKAAIAAGLVQDKEGHWVKP